MKALLLLMAVFSSGERETIAILSARVRYGLSQRPEMPDQPPNIELRNLKNGASGLQVKEDASKGNASQPAQDKGRSLVDYDLLEARYEIEDLRREAEIAKGNLKASADELARLRAEPPRFVTIFTGEDEYGVGWCVNCGPLKDRWGDANGFIQWSTAKAPGDQIYPAIRFMDASGAVRFPADNEGKYRAPATVDDLMRLVNRNKGVPSTFGKAK